MGFYGNNNYRNNIRRKNTILNLISSLRTLIVIAIIIGGMYYFLHRTDIVQDVKEQTYETFEVMTGHQSSEIGKIIIKSNKKLENIDYFMEKYGTAEYKLNAKESMKVQKDLEVYYVYDKNNNFMFEVHDLGNGTIGVYAMTGYMKVYDRVK